MIAMAILPLLFVSTVMMLRCCSKAGRLGRTEAMLGVQILFILLLGTVLVTISTPIAREALAAKTELLESCKIGERTRPLYVQYQVLQSFRSNATCAAKSSVAQCSGFQATRETAMLQRWETTLKCAGFCFYPNVTANDKKPDMVDLYPPSLFTTVPFQGSCSAMAARNMESYVADIAQQLQFEGLFLIGLSVLQGFFVMKATATKRDEYDHMKMQELRDRFTAIARQDAGDLTRQDLLQFLKVHQWQLADYGSLKTP